MTTIRHRRHARRRSLLVASALSGLLALTSCASDADASDSFASAPALEPVEVDATIELVGGDESRSFAELETLPMYEVDLYEPFVEAQSVFQGPKLHDVFEEFGLDAGQIEIRALNDYGFAAAVDDWPEDALLATRENGEPIEVDAGGPFRVVFPDGSAWSEELDTWVWSVDRLVPAG